MISRLQPKNVDVLSLTTIATPHRGKNSLLSFSHNLDRQTGSAFADYVLERIGSKKLALILTGQDWY